MELSTSQKPAYDPSIDTALLGWIFGAAPFGILITNPQLEILYSNLWLQRAVGNGGLLAQGSGLFDAFPDVKVRGFDRYYGEALEGRVRVLSHRFHKYLLPLAPATRRGDFELMQQSSQIGPFMSREDVLGTITVIEDVTDRVALERELNLRITETQRLLKSEISARELAEENNRIRDSYEVLKNEGSEILQISRTRDILMHRIITAQEEERRRIARDIHDNLGQQLTALRFAISRLRNRNVSDPVVSEDIDIAEKITLQLDSEVDFLARRVRPTQIDDLGLEAALQAFIDEWSEHVGIAATFYPYGLKHARLEPEVEINLYRIAQEALNNISKHADAKRATVLLEYRENGVALIIEDDGAGFEADIHRTIQDGLGIFGMKERCALIGGFFEIESNPDKGTTIYVKVEMPPISVEAG